MKSFFPRLFGVLGLMCTLGVCGTTSSSDGWYTSQQAAAGAKAYRKSCASCHGDTLQGGMGPVLVGKPFWQAYGARRSRLCGRAYTHKCRRWHRMAFLLHKNGVPAGATPLDDTVDLSKALPSK